MPLSRSELARTIGNQVTLLRRNGVRTKLPHSQEVFVEATNLWCGNPTQSNQCLWRQAALAHGAVLGFAGQWRDALSVYDGNPNMVPFDSDAYPVPETAKNHELAAMMNTNSAIGCLRRASSSDRSLANIFAKRALASLSLAIAPQLNRWRAVSVVILAYGYQQSGMERDSKCYASLALGYVHPSQPELRVLARELAGTGDGLIKAGLFSRQRKAMLQTPECLYYFNE